MRCSMYGFFTILIAFMTPSALGAYQQWLASKVRQVTPPYQAISQVIRPGAPVSQAASRTRKYLSEKLERNPTWKLIADAAAELPERQDQLVEYLYALHESCRRDADANKCLSLAFDRSGAGFTNKEDFLFEVRNAEAKGKQHHYAAAIPQKSVPNAPDWKQQLINTFAFEAKLVNTPFRFYLFGYGAEYAFTHALSQLYQSLEFDESRLYKTENDQTSRQVAEAMLARRADVEMAAQWLINGAFDNAFRPARDEEAAAIFALWMRDARHDGQSNGQELGDKEIGLTPARWMGWVDRLKQIGAQNRAGKRYARKAAAAGLNTLRCWDHNVWSWLQHKTADKGRVSFHVASLLYGFLTLKKDAEQTSREIVKVIERDPQVASMAFWKLTLMAVVELPMAVQADLMQLMLLLTDESMDKGWGEEFANTAVQNRDYIEGVLKSNREQDADARRRLNGATNPSLSRNDRTERPSVAIDRSALSISTMYDDVIRVPGVTPSASQMQIGLTAFYAKSLSHSQLERLFWGNGKPSHVDLAIHDLVTALEFDYSRTSRNLNETTPNAAMSLAVSVATQWILHAEDLLSDVTQHETNRANGERIYTRSGPLWTGDPNDFGKKRLQFWQDRLKALYNQGGFHLFGGMAGLDGRAKIFASAAEEALIEVLDEMDDTLSGSGSFSEDEQEALGV